jgi:hypothetical protein
MNADAPESALPDWSEDPDALAEHVRAYFISLGVEPCQIERSNILAGSGGRTVALARGIESIVVVESLAVAQIRSNDESTNEAFYWPAISADVLAKARDLRDRLADPALLASYKAKLPPEVQGDGMVVIHHTSGLSTHAFEAAALYDVTPATELGLRGVRSFDADGNEVKTFTDPLLRQAVMLVGAHGATTRFVLLGSVASRKYVDPLVRAFGYRLFFPPDFVGRGDMSRGGLMLRAANSGEELTYRPVEGTNLHGPRLARLTPRARSRPAGR